MPRFPRPNKSLAPPRIHAATPEYLSTRGFQAPRELLPFRPTIALPPLLNHRPVSGAPLPHRLYETAPALSRSDRAIQSLAACAIRHPVGAVQPRVGSSSQRGPEAAWQFSGSSQTWI